MGLLRRHGGLATKRGAFRPKGPRTFEDDFDALAPAWEAALGTFAVEGGLLVAAALAPDGTNLLANENPGFETGAVSPWESGSNVTATIVEDSRPGGSGSHCADLVVAQAGNYLLLAVWAPASTNSHLVPMIINGVTYQLAAWVRKLADDAYPVALQAFWVPQYIEVASTLSTQWVYVQGVSDGGDNSSTQFVVRFPDQTPAGVGARIDDASVRVMAAIQTLSGWQQEDVQIEAELYTASATSSPRGIVLRYVDATNYVLVLCEPYGAVTRLAVYDVHAGIWTKKAGASPTWTVEGYDRIRVRVMGDFLRVDLRPDGADEWTVDALRTSVVNTHSTRHGIALYRADEPVVNQIRFEACVIDEEGLGETFQETISVPGALTQNLVYDYQFPWCELRHVSMVQSNAGAGRIKVGTTADDDAFLTYTNMGKSGVPVELTAPDQFRYKQVPNISSAATFRLTIDYDGAAGTPAQDVEIVMSFVRI